ncbi:hypothetical protein NC651_009357 [Populus alba x Populus x berolinensis]|nr:hypothetical protein NC651_009357 [Populus alba x Populus x berolinensis]
MLDNLQLKKVSVFEGSMLEHCRITLELYSPFVCFLIIVHKLSVLSVSSQIYQKLRNIALYARTLRYFFNVFQWENCLTSSSLG